MDDHSNHGNQKRSLPFPNSPGMLTYLINYQRTTLDLNLLLRCRIAQTDSVGKRIVAIILDANRQIITAYTHPFLTLQQPTYMY